MTSTTGAFRDSVFLAQVAALKKQQDDEMVKLLLGNGRINSDMVWPAKYGGIMTFENVDGCCEFIKSIYDHMLEETIGGYRNTRVSIPGVPYTIMDIDFYLGESKTREADVSRDIADVRLRMVDPSGTQCPNKEYHIVITQETPGSEIQEVFTGIKKDLCVNLS